jgi:hypothetical protein
MLEGFMDVNERSLDAVVRARRIARREKLLSVARASSVWTPWIVMLEAGVVYLAAILAESRGLASHTFFPALLFFLMSGHVVYLHRRLDALASLVEWNGEAEGEQP